MLERRPSLKFRMKYGYILDTNIRIVLTDNIFDIDIDYIGFVKLFPIPIPNLLPHHTTGKFRVQTGHHTVQ